MDLVNYAKSFLKGGEEEGKWEKLRSDTPNASMQENHIVLIIFVFFIYRTHRLEDDATQERNKSGNLKRIEKSSGN